MKLFTYTTTLLLVGAALTFAAPDQNAVEIKEKAAWQAFKDKKTDDFKKLVAADFIGVYADGISTLQGELDGMQKSDLKSFP